MLGNMKRVPSERSFGLSVGGVCAAIGVVSWWRGHDLVGPTLGGAGMLLVIFGLVMPRMLQAPNRVWWRFAQVIGWINARVLLSVFFFAVLSPVGIVMRLLGRNPLRTPRSDTTWSPVAAGRRGPRHYERMF
jgi:hypothetical protein